MRTTSRTTSPAARRLQGEDGTVCTFWLWLSRALCVSLRVETLCVCAVCLLLSDYRCGSLYCCGCAMCLALCFSCLVMFCFAAFLSLPLFVLARTLLHTY
jgi:hypothetical protein